MSLDYLAERVPSVDAYSEYVDVPDTHYLPANTVKALAGSALLAVQEYVKGLEERVKDLEHIRWMEGNEARMLNDTLTASEQRVKWLESRTESMEYLRDIQEMAQAEYRAEQAEANARGWADSFKQAEAELAKLEEATRRYPETLAIERYALKRAEWMLMACVAETCPFGERSPEGVETCPHCSERMVDLISRYEKENRP